MTAAYRMADRLASGELEPVLRVLREQDHQSWEFISRRLYADYGIEAAGVTVKAWCESLGIGTDKAGAA
jgi:hypothetical protein